MSILVFSPSSWAFLLKYSYKVFKSIGSLPGQNNLDIVKVSSAPFPSTLRLPDFWSFRNCSTMRSDQSGAREGRLWPQWIYDDSPALDSKVWTWSYIQLGRANFLNFRKHPSSTWKTEDDSNGWYLLLRALQNAGSRCILNFQFLEIRPL